MNKTTKRLLLCGMAAGPLFIAVALVQALTRSGFDLTRQPISFLSLGDLGWIQIVNFLLSGALVIALAIGIRRTLRSQVAGTWGPWFVGSIGLGLIIAGLFHPDAGFGFPPGTPTGAPVHLTYHSMLHGIGFTLSFVSFVLACIAFIRRDAANKQQVRIAYTTAIAITTLVLSMWPGTKGVAMRDFVAALFLWAWITAQSVWLLAKDSQDHA